MSKIEWTDDTWNPIIGCDKISDGCKNCYAINTAWIRQHNPKMKDKYQNVVEKTTGGKLNWTGQINLHEPSLLKPLKTKKPTMFFVNSMSDLFHEDVPFEFIDKVFAVMAACPQHTFQILTKRANRLPEWYERAKKRATMWANMSVDYGEANEPEMQNACKVAFSKVVEQGQWPLPNVWLGVSVENQKAADERIPYLLNVPAAVRFLSCEPLLGPVDIQRAYGYRGFGKKCTSCSGKGRYSDNFKTPCPECKQTGINPNPIDQVIVGGESGTKDARPMHPDWARSLRDQCKAAGVAFFFKQWGEYYTRWMDMRIKEGDAYVFKYYTSYKEFAAKDWVNKGDKCISIDGTECKIGGDFKTCAYPVAIMQRVGKKKAGRLLDGVEYSEYPKQKEAI